MGFWFLLLAGLSAGPIFIHPLWQVQAVSAAVAGAGLLLRRRWGRNVALVVLWILVGFGTIAVVVTVGLFLRACFETGFPPAALWGMVAFNVGWLGWNVGLLRFLTRPATVSLLQ